MCGPQIQLCLFMLKSLITLDSLSRLGGAVVTHPLWVQALTGSIPGSCKGFLCLNFCFVVDVILLFVQKHIICHKGGGKLSYKVNDIQENWATM